MADVNRAGRAGYRPEMDEEAHESTYGAFTHFTVVSTVFVACIVVALAVGGAKHGWISSMVMTVAAMAAAGIGLASRSLAWKPGAVVLAILLLMLLLY